MFLILAFLFIMIPVVELRILWSLGESIGIMQTLLVVVVTGVAGAHLARSQGVKVINSINNELQSGKMPADSLLSAALVLVGGVLLITPGIMTDAFGLCLLIPPFRSVIAALLKKYFKSHFNIVNINNFQGGAGSNFQSHSQSGDEFVDVNVVDEEDEEK